MRLIFFLLLFVNSISIGYSQKKTLNDFYLMRTLKQDGEQFNFLILDDDKRGVLFYNKKKFYYWYKAQHVLQTQGGSSGSILHGGFESFYTNKQLAKKGDFNRGLKNGQWMYWREDGTLSRSESWKKGNKAGFEKWYDENGDVYQTIKHKRSKSVLETRDSTVVSKKDGRIKTSTYNDENGNITRIEETKDGRLHGKVETYETGELITSEKYKNGEYVQEKNKAKKDSLDTSDDRKWWQVLKKRKDAKEAVNVGVETENIKKSKTKKAAPDKKEKSTVKKSKKDKGESIKDDKSAKKPENEKKKVKDDKKSKP